MSLSWESKLILFMSVDISGSTKFKSSYSDNSDVPRMPPPWTSIFSEFYQNFPVIFKGKIIDDQAYVDLLGRMALWKILGDELIFRAIVKSADEVFYFLKCFTSTIEECNKEIGQRRPLRLKGAAWTAGFPVRNTVITIDSVGPTSIVDYIGPDMDIGFRLGKCAKPGRMVVSLDLADIITRDGARQGIECRHVGWQVLDGVFENKPYPIIWIDDGYSKRIAPWEVESCEMTNSYQKNGPTDRRKIQGLCSDIRDALSHLLLVPPYFSEEEMPEIHRKIKLRAEEEQRDQLDIGRPLGEEE